MNRGFRNYSIIILSILIIGIIGITVCYKTKGVEIKTQELGGELTFPSP